ncbi:MAG: peptide chain release factor 1 [Candidatus Aureabacteria bacterium]|nr:peptide chain release factor 1 [Candidatus Auribacterota bacterium]
MLKNLSFFKQKLSELEKSLADNITILNPEKYRETAKEHGRISQIVSIGTKLEKVVSDLDSARNILNSQTEDEELVSIAKEEIADLEEQKALIEKQYKILLIPSDKNDSRNTIIEVRAGTGGEEASLFAADIARMYIRYAERVGWKVEILNSNETEKHGFKEIIFSLEGENVYKRIKYESGVHRVQRVPETEASGRIHTSAVTVAVMPEAEDIDVQIKPEDLRIDTYRASGAGGQHVNKTDSAVRITHIPTNTIVACQDNKSQHKNKAQAMKVLKARIYEKIQQDENRKRSTQRKTMIGTGDRSAKIRTYNFPQSRVTDHRIGLSLHNLDEIMNGNLGPLLDALIEKDHEEKLRLL